MANQEHVAILAKGVETWNDWRNEHPNIRPNLQSANLRDADLHHANLRFVDLGLSNLRGAILAMASLSGSNLAGANLSNADLGSADLRSATVAGATLEEANLSGADLVGADMRGVNLCGAALLGANLISANLTGADLRQSDFRGVVISGTSFGNVDLSNVNGLDGVLHVGPSSIGVDTLFRSHVAIPEQFLRGCGVPEDFITFMRSLTGAAFEFYSCFISYSTKDQAFAERLHADLQARSVRCWFAPHDIQGGQKVHEQIDEAIRLYDKLLLILSDASMTSPWVKTEIANARARETQQQGQMLFPISLVPFDRIREWKCFDADTGIDSAREIREYFVPDFSNWKDHDSYSRALEKLVRGLRAGPEKATTTAE